MIEQFLEAVYGEAQGRTSVWWRAEPGEKSPIDRQKWFTWPQDREQIKRFIEANIAKDVYIPVSLFDADERKPEHATLVHTLWQDTDTFNPDDYRAKPSIVVATSEGRTHCWFLLDKPYPAEQAEIVVRKMTYAHRPDGADVSSWSRNKLLRVPGTYNSSHGFPELVTADFTDNVYTLAELANLYDDVPLPTASSSTVGATAVQAPPLPDDFPDFFDAQAKLPEDFPLELLTAEPAEGYRSELRWKLLAELIEAGLTDEEAFVIARQSPAASKWLEDRRGDDGLWGEIAKERARYEAGVVVDAEPARPKQGTRVDTVELLTEPERRRARERFKKTWIYEYEEWVKSNLKIYNAPYHRAAAWMALSQLVGEVARINVRGKDTPLCLYFLVLGETTSGKSEAKEYMQDVIHRGYTGPQKNPDLGDDVSIGALLDILRDRPKGASMMSSDEVDGLFMQMRDKSGWRASDMATWTYLYDGKVQPVARKGQTDKAGDWTKTMFSWFGMGTPGKVINTLDRTMFESGFLARFQWFLGEKVEVEEADLGVSLGGEASFRERAEKISEWRGRFAVAKQSWGMNNMSAEGGDLPIIEPDSEGTREFLKAKTGYLEYTLWADDPNRDILRPSLRRTNITVAKMAALLAISEGRHTFTKDDLLVALLHCEKLLANLHYMASQVASSEHSKQLNGLYEYILAHGPDAKSERIFRAMSERHGLDVLTVERYRDELRAQGRVSYVATGAKHAWAATAIEQKDEA